MAACVWQAATVVAVGQIITNGVSEATVKVAWQVWVAWQVELSVKVTVVEPPQNDGASVLSLVKTALHPPEKLAVANHAANWASTASCA